MPTIGHLDSIPSLRARLVLYVLSQWLGQGKPTDHVLNLMQIQTCQNCCTTSVLQRQVRTSPRTQCHFSLGCRGADDRIDVPADVLQPREGRPQTHPVLVEGQSTFEAVKEDPDRRRFVFLEGRRVDTSTARVPHQTFVGQAPAFLVLPKQVHKGIHMQPSTGRCYSEHHACTKHTTRHPHFPVIDAAVQASVATNSCSSIAPVRVKQRRALTATTKAYLMRLICCIPRPLDPAPILEGWREWIPFGCSRETRVVFEVLLLTELRCWCGVLMLLCIGLLVLMW